MPALPYPKYIDPVSSFGGLLLGVEKPGRYVGGEFGRLAKKDAQLQTLIAFPDLYEIGMSNQAFRIIYNSLNRVCGISCDRAFAPAPDFEKLLREKNIPMYGLDTGISLGSLDLLMFTLGFELGINGILTMLDVSGIPLYCRDRTENDPIVLAGGPAVSNPLPYSLFVDAFWIGEAEAGFTDLATELLELKKRGQGRAALFEKISSHPNVWVKGKALAKRAVDACFSKRGLPKEGLEELAVFPIPCMKTVQHHGVLEIMRGCPNGCRFCLAGFWYRPMRQKKPQAVLAQAAALVNLGGWREISLSSLSSGDYDGVGELVDDLNRQFAQKHVSFQMPSLKISSFSLPLLEKISQTRRSGLTFAIETPEQASQLSLNKEANKESLIAIIREAKKRGWKGAKFYFMIGLPVSQGASQSDETGIVNFISDVGRLTNMRFNINIGIFVPKPHTPYQRCAQLDTKTAMAKLDFIKQKLKPLGHKVSISDPLLSIIEGVFSRGDERAGELALQAFRGGSRLDAWAEYMNKEAWLEILEKNGDLIEKTLCEKTPEAPLPWQAIDSGVSRTFLQREIERSASSCLTEACKKNCIDPCGVCNKQIEIHNNTDNTAKNADANEKIQDVTLKNNAVNRQVLPLGKSDPSIYRVLFSFSKKGSAVFHGHLSLVETLSMCFNRAGFPVLYTQGFNPLAKIEIASPLATGITAEAEIAAADFAGHIDAAIFAEKLNLYLPQGIRVENAQTYCIPGGIKKHSLSSLLWGFGYCRHNLTEIEYVKAVDEKKTRQNLLELAAGEDASLFSLKRVSVLAKDGESGWGSYFDAYGYLYKKV